MLIESEKGTPGVGVFSAATAMQRARGLRFSHERKEVKLWDELLFPFIKFIGAATIVLILVMLASLWPTVLLWGLRAVENALF